MKLVPGQGEEACRPTISNADKPLSFNKTFFPLLFLFSISFFLFFLLFSMTTTLQSNTYMTVDTPQSTNKSPINQRYKMDSRSSIHFLAGG
jgi:hypothetical protein